MSGWDACTFEPNASLRWIECHPALAGYIGAIGTVAAVFVAFLAPSISAAFAARQRRAERRANSRAIARMLGTAVIDVGIAVEKRKKMLDRHKDAPPNPLNWQPWFDELLIPIVPQLEFLHQQIDVDEEIIEPFRAVVRSAGNWNSIRFQVRNDGFTKAVDIWNQEWRILDEALAEVRDAITAVTHQYVAPD